MKTRFARGITVAVAFGLVVLGATQASGSTAATTIKFKEATQLPDLVARFSGAVVDGKVYFLGWRVGDGTTTDGSVYYYDIAKKKFVDTGTDMPTPVSNYNISVLKDKTGTGLYIFGGRDANGDIVTDTQVYYPASNTAKEIKTDPWPGTTPSACVSLPATGVATVGNVAYVMGGMSFSTSVPACTDDNSAQTWAFDPTAKAGKKWTAGPKLPQAEGYVTTAVLGTTIYAIGGDVNAAGTLTAQTMVASWKVGSKKWSDSAVADLPEACDESVAAALATGPLANTITLLGCGQWSSAIADVQQYDVSSDSWSTVGQLNEARRNQAGAMIGTAKKPSFMVFGGYASDGATELQSTEIGTPSSFGLHRTSAATRTYSKHAPLF